MTTCRNCGYGLTEVSIALAVEDAGIVREELSFYCSTYDEERAICPGMSRDEQEHMAYWTT